MHFATRIDFYFSIHYTDNYKMTVRGEPVYEIQKQNNIILSDLYFSAISAHYHNHVYRFCSDI